jgi:multidrug resistance protein MdtO
MATPVLEGAGGRPLALASLLAMRPGRWEYALRVGVIGALTCLVAEIYQTPDIALTIYIAFFLNQKNRTASVIQNIAFVVLISIVIGLIMVVTNLVLDDPLWRVATMVLLSFGCLFLGSASKLRPIGATLALVMAYALDLLGSVPVGEVATRGLLYAWLFVGIPAGISIVVNLLIAPSPRHVAEREIALRLRLSACALRDGDVGRQFGEVLREGCAAPLALLRLAHLERSVTEAQIAALKQAVLSATAILSAVDAALRYRFAFSAALTQQLVAGLERTAEELERGPAPITLDLSLHDAPPEARAVAEEIALALAQFGLPQADEAKPKPKPKAPFFQPDAFTNPDHVRFALKTTAAAMLCYLFYSLTDWSGIHTCFITCYIVSLTTAGESIEKLTLRIVGCLLGAAVGFAVILFVLPQLTSIGALMALVFRGLVGAGYVAAGSPRISYAGLQIAFAFLMCVVQGPSPAFDFIVARDRVIGILIGNAVSYLVFAHLWPVSVGRRIDPAIAALLKRLAGLARNRQDRVAAADLHEAIGAVENDLTLARYEPQGLRPPTAWCDARKQVLADSTALGELLPLLRDDRLALGSAEVFERPHDATPLALPTDDPVGGLFQTHLSGLEQGLLLSAQTEETIHAPA